MRPLPAVSRPPVQASTRFGWVNNLTPVYGSQAPTQFLIKFFQLSDARLLMLLQEPQRLSNDFAGRVVSAILDLRLHKPLESGVSETFMATSRQTISPMTDIVNP